MSSPDCIPSYEPKEFTAGDTVQWSRTLTEFPSTDYLLTYILRGPAEIKLTAAVYQTSDYLVTVAAADSAKYGAGVYSFAAYVTDIATGMLRYTVHTRFPVTTVNENPANYAKGAATNLSYAATTLALVETTIQQLSSRQVSTASVNGQSYSIQQLNELVKWRNRLREEVQSEQDAINVKAGLGAKKNVLVRFPLLSGGAQWLPGVTTGGLLPPGDWS